MAELQASELVTESWNLAFPTRLTPPTLVGTIRRKPEDFVVTEELGYPLTGDGEHLYIDVEKRNANTGWVAWQLAEHLGVRELDIGFAGRKDRHAVTRQWFSAWIPGTSMPDSSHIRIEGVTVHAVTRHRQKLRRGELARNLFRLRVCIEDVTSAGKQEIESRLMSLRERGFPNYFGEQRFGRNGANLDRADRMLRGKEKQGRDGGMIMSAARSWLFNQYLAHQLTAGIDIQDMTGPLIGKVRDPQPGEENLDTDMREWVAGLRRLGMKADTRPLVAMPSELEWQFHDSALLLSFGLPAGAYATSLLREIFILKDASQ